MSDLREAWRTYGGSIVDRQLPTVDPVLIYAKSTVHRIAVQEIAFSPSAYVASVLSFLDSRTGESIGSLSVPAVRPDRDGTFTLWLGDAGTKLSAGANLILATTNGAAGRLNIAAFQRGR